MKAWIYNITIIAGIALVGFGCSSPRMRGATPPPVPVMESPGEAEPDSRVIIRRQTTVKSTAPLLASDEDFEKAPETP